MRDASTLSAARRDPLPILRFGAARWVMLMLASAGLVACGGVGDGGDAAPVTSAPPATAIPSKVNVAVVGPTAAPIEGVVATVVGSSAGAAIAVSAAMAASAVAGAGTAIRNNGAHGLHFDRGTAVDVVMEGAAATGNGLSGMTFIAGSTCRLRNSRVAGNATYGIRLGTSNGQGSTCDLGSAAGAGGNVFDNAGTSLFMEHFGMRVSAVGNTWTPLQQGADAQGRYVVPAGQTSLSINGPRTSGRNFGIAESNTVLLLAE